MPELDITLDLGGKCKAGFAFRRNGKHLIKPSERNAGFAEIGKYPAELTGGPYEQGRIAREYHQFANGDLLFNDEHDACAERDSYLRIAYGIGNAPEERHELSKLIGLFTEITVFFCKAVKLALLLAEGAHNAHTRNILLNIVAQYALGFIRSGEVFLCVAEVDERDNHERRHDDYGIERKLNVH